ASDQESKSRKDRKEKFGEFEVVQDDYTFTHLWTIDFDADASKLPEPKRLTEGTNFTVGGFAWSPDSSRIAFGATRNPDLGSNTTGDIYVLQVSDKYIRKIVDTPGPDFGPVWSPDGSQVAYATSNGAEFFFYTNNRIAVVPAE